MGKKDLMRSGILVNDDCFDFQDICLKLLDSLNDFNEVMSGKGFDKSKYGYSDSYVKVCTLFEAALIRLDIFIDDYSIDFIDKRYTERDSSYENSKFIY